MQERRRLASARCGATIHYICQVTMTGIFALFAVYCIKFSNSDYFGNTTIYTQAANEWSQLPWVDFTWASGPNCPLGYEPISAYWSGTSNGNITRSEVIVVPDDSRYGYDYRKFEPMYQTSMFSDMADALCGQRGSFPFIYADKARKVNDKFECSSQNLKPCTSDVSAEGLPLCVPDLNDCPITEIKLLSADKLTNLDSRFTVRKSSGSGAH